MEMDKNLVREVIAKRVAQEFHDGYVVNLGIGLPTLVANYVGDMDVIFQSENGCIGVGPAPEKGKEDPYLVNAGGGYITAAKGAMFFDSAYSFGIIRGGHVDATVLGALEVDEKGNLANWMIPGKKVPGMGGAMDLVVGAKHVIVAMEHTSNGAIKILKECKLPLTAVGVVDLIITEKAVFEVTDKGLVLKEITPYSSLEDIRATTEADFIISDELKDKINFHGIRLDSGDIAYLSKEARKMLDEAGYPNAKIVASNDLDEDTITHLKQEGACIDAWGVGTKLITAYDNPALGAVYKLACLENDNGEMIDRLKVSENPAKLTVPGVKKVYRIINTDTGMAAGDYIALEKEDVNAEQSIKLFHPTHTYLAKEVENFKAIDIHEDIFVNGKQVYEVPTVQESAKYFQQNKGLLWNEYLRLLNPEFYPVDLSTKCWENRKEILERVTKKSK